MDRQDGSHQLGLPLGHAAAVLALRSQLAPVAWAFARAAPGARLGYVQGAAEDPPAGHSHLIHGLCELDLLAGSLSVGASLGGGEGEALTVAAALHRGLTVLGWDAALVGPGPEISEEDSPLGPASTAILDCAHTALALGCSTLLVPRMSSTDRGHRRGISPHTIAVLDLLLQPVAVALPAGMRSPVGAQLHAGLGAVFATRRPARPQLELDIERPVRIARHDWRRAPVDLPAFAAGRLPAAALDRGLLEDPLFFGGALAGGVVLAELAQEAAYSEEDEDAVA